jgi:hypothetical protein
LLLFGVEYPPEDSAMAIPGQQRRIAAGMRRREFIALVGSAAAWPLTARAQQSERVRLIALFPFGAEGDPEAKTYVRAVREGLEKLGWNRWAEHPNRSSLA